jgi:hypothetical protein
MKFKDFLFEQREKHAVMAFGRLNPPTLGHEKLVNKVKSIAQKVGGTAHIVVSHSQDSEKNPLSAAQKLKHAKRAFPGVHVMASDKEAPNFLAQAAKLHKAGVTHFHMVGGQDRVEEFHNLLHKYNGVKGPHGRFNFKKIEVHSAGDRDPDSEGVEGMSASKMREHAKTNNFAHFKKGVPSTMSHEHAFEMFKDVRKGMGLKEDVNTDFEELLNEGVHDKSIFKAVFLAGGPGSGKDYVLDNTLQGHGLVEINSDKALEFLMDKHGLDKTMPATEKHRRDLVRGKAKNMTELRQRLALMGRNGLIINGTGDDAEKIGTIKKKLEELGYESSMVMVNTADDVSMQRNIERGQRGGRTVPEEIRKQKWDASQNARPKYAEMFKDNYHEFDNSQDLRTAPPEVVKAKTEELTQIYKNIQKFTNKPAKNDTSKNWIASELQRKDLMKVNKEVEVKEPHSSSKAAEDAKKRGLQYYGFGRYGTNGKVTFRSVHDRLVEVPKEPMKKPVNEEFEELIAEDLRKWFSKTDPEGGWKRINSKGEAIGPCAREPGEPKPKCMSNEKRAKLSKKERASAVAAKRRHDPVADRSGKGGKPVNVSNFGKGKLSESYELSDRDSLNVLLLGTSIDEVDLNNFEEQKKPKYLTDKNGKVRTFMLRAAAAREAHTQNGIVMPYKNGYVIKLNEENEDVKLSEESIFNTTTRSSGLISENTKPEKRRIIGGTTAYGFAKKHAYAGEETSSDEESSGQIKKITLAEIWKGKKEVKESIDKGIEPGISMAAAGESIGRDMGEKNRKKDGKVTVTNEMTGDETGASIGAQKEDELKKKGINLSTFKTKNPI